MARIFYHAVPPDWRREQKYHFLDTHEDLSKIEWKEVKPDKSFNWLTHGFSEEYECFVPFGTKETKVAEQADVQSIFKSYSRGVSTSRDSWAYN